MIKTVLKAAAFLLAALTFASLLVLPATQAAYGGIYEKTLRFHVLANSDGEVDQELKMKVKDGLIDYLTPILENCEGVEESEEKLASMLGQIEDKAKEILAREGSDLFCKVVLGREYYPTRDYENLSYPAGEYRSLRVYLGRGEGKNWWCVLFPPLCLDAATADSGMEKAGYTDDEQALVTQKDAGCTVRFFILDVAAKIKKWFS